MSDRITYAIVCVGGWKYVGRLVDVNVSLLGLGALEWVKIETKKGIVRVNAKHIVSILEYGDRKKAATRKAPSVPS